MITPNQPIVCVDSTLGSTNQVPSDWDSRPSYYSGDFTFVTGGVQIGGGTAKTTVDFLKAPCKNAILRIYVDALSLAAGSTATLAGLNNLNIDSVGWWQIPITSSIFDIILGDPSDIIVITDMEIYCFSVDEEECTNCKTGDYSQPILINLSPLPTNTDSLSLQMDGIFCQTSIVLNFCESPASWILATSAPYDDQTWIEFLDEPCSLVVDGGCTPEQATSAWEATAETNIDLVTGGHYSITLTLGELDGEFCGNVDILIDGVIVSNAENIACPGEHTFYFTWAGSSGLFPLVIRVQAQNVNGVYKAKMELVGIAINRASGATVTLLPSNSLTSVSYANNFKTSYVFGAFTAAQPDQGHFFYQFGFTSDTLVPYSQYDCFRMIITQDYGCSSDMQYCITETYKWITDTCNTIRVLASQDVTDEKGACAFGFQYPPSGVFTGGFFHRTRIYGELRNPQFDGEMVSYQDSAGRKRVVYAESREFMEMAVNLSPKYVHNFLRLACRHDIFNLNDSVLPQADYFTRSETYSPTWIRTRTVAPAFLEIEVKEQNLRKDPCCDGLPVNPTDCETTCEPCPEEEGGEG
jgi:hypothetical protein